MQNDQESYRNDRISWLIFELLWSLIQQQMSKQPYENTTINMNVALNYYKSPERIGSRDNDFLNPPTWPRSLMEIIGGWIDSSFHPFISKRKYISIYYAYLFKKIIGNYNRGELKLEISIQKKKKIELLFIKSEFVIFVNYKLLCIYSERSLEIVIVKNWNWKFNIKKLSYYLSRICYFFELYFSVLQITVYLFRDIIWKKTYY